MITNLGLSRGRNVRQGIFVGFKVRMFALCILVVNWPHLDTSSNYLQICNLYNLLYIHGRITRSLRPNWIKMR